MVIDIDRRVAHHGRARSWRCRSSRHIPSPATFVIGVAWSVIAFVATGLAAPPQPTPVSQIVPRTLKVAAVQMRSTRDLDKNAGKIVEFLGRCAADGTRVVVFPECAVTGYFDDAVRRATAEQLVHAERQIAAACRRHHVYTVVGTPWRQGDKLLNSAVIIGPDGRVIERYHKIQLAEQWPEPGDHLSIYRIDGIWCTTIVCHDERYPELVRLPVIAGAQIVFYISSESGLRAEHKMGPYRAQIQARAVENRVWVVQANTPANPDASGSHGQSRIIQPDGNLVREASIFGEEVVTATLSIDRADRAYAKRSLHGPPLQSWWKSGLRHVRIIE